MGTDAFLDITLPQLNPAFVERFHGMFARGVDRGADWSTAGRGFGRTLLLEAYRTRPRGTPRCFYGLQTGRTIDQHGHSTQNQIRLALQFIENDEHRKFVRMEIESAPDYAAMYKIVQTNSVKEQMIELLRKDELRLRPFAAASGLCARVS